MKKYIILLASVLVCISCGGMLDITPPNNITEEQILELLASGDDDKVDLVLTAIGSGLQLYLNSYNLSDAGSGDTRYYTQQGLDAMRSFEGNDIVFGDQISTSFGWDEYNLENFTGTAVDKNEYYWNTYARIIQTYANSKLVYFTEDLAASNDGLAEARAACLVLRAFGYMSLMENYQDAYTNGGSSKLGMSLYDTYDPLQDAVARSTSAETYEFILADLDEAVSLLEQTGLGYNTSDYEDIDMGVVRFLRARANLWYGQYSDVITDCNAIINSGAYSLIPVENYGGHDTGAGMAADGGDSLLVLPTTNAFTCMSINPECIFGFDRSSSNLSGVSSYTTWSYWLNPFYSGRTVGRVSSDLYDLMDDNDCRKAIIVTDEIGDYLYNSSGNTYLYIPSYINLKCAATVGISNDEGSSLERTDCGVLPYCKWRLSEVYLMLAEAYAQNGNDSSAESTLNTLLAARTVDGATTLTCDNYTGMSSLSALEKVQLQYRIELWGEGGREFFNNKRWGIDVDRGGNHISTNTYYAWEDMTLDIPQDELLYNSNCVQN